jgi:hypothetical protein
MEHVGVNTDDPRNAGIISYFSPRPVSRGTLLRAFERAPRLRFLQRRLERALESFDRHAFPPDPPVSQSLDQVADPWFGLGTHPDIIEGMWKLDGSLPQRCKWVFWGRPALVHPQTGIVFAVGFGTIGVALRLPQQALADPLFASVSPLPRRKQNHDISRAGPEWRLIAGRCTVEGCRAAYDFAS